MSRSLVFFFLLLMPGFYTKAQIVAFVDESKAMDIDFVKNSYPNIAEIAAGLDLDVRKVDVREGAPSEITVTPQLVFQNENGRSFYIGRYSELSRFKTFLRTVARNPQKSKPNLKKSILFNKNGRTITALPLKITRPTGSFDQDDDQFMVAARNAFYLGFSRFSFAQELDLQRTNRLFYVDIHPYFGDEGNIFLSYEIYSQFNCVVPVFTKLSDPLIGDARDYEKVFTELGGIIENKVEDLTKNSRNGDGFSVIAETIPMVDWSALSLELKELNSVQLLQISADDLSGQWTILGAIDKITPLIQFNFYAPLDNYAGEVKNLSGQLNWNSDRLSGNFQVNTKDVTMGEEAYDDNVHKKYIRVKRFPEASFVFADALLDPVLLLNSEPSLTEISGTFSFMGKEREVTALANIIPFEGDAGNLLIAVSAEFDINVFEHSKVNGPDGPKVARENMHFQMNFLMGRLNNSINHNSNSK